MSPTYFTGNDTKLDKTVRPIHSQVCFYTLRRSRKTITNTQFQPEHRRLRINQETFMNQYYEWKMEPLISRQ